MNLNAITATGMRSRPRTLLACALLACAACQCALGKQAAGVKPGTPCADVSAATMMKKTHGAVPDCTIGRIIKLCARNPLGRNTQSAHVTVL